MNPWVKAMVVMPVVILIVFAYSVHKLNSAQLAPLASSIKPVNPPMPLIKKEVTFEKLVDSLNENADWFRQVFFEVMTFKGVKKNRFGKWTAFFADKHSKLYQLSEQEEHDGVKLLLVSPEEVIVTYGNLERKFYMH